MKAADQIQRSNDSPNSHTGKQFLFLEEGNPSGQRGLSVKKTLLFWLLLVCLLCMSTASIAAYDERLPDGVNEIS